MILKIKKLQLMEKLLFIFDSYIEINVVEVSKANQYNVTVLINGILVS